MIRFLVTATMTGFFAFAGPATASDDDHDHHLSELHGVKAIHAWTRATSDDHALVFVEIENETDKEVILLGGEADNAGSVDLVGFQLVDGKAVYTPLPQVPVAAGSELHLEPEALAMRLEGLTGKLEKGQEFEMEIEFDIGHMDVHVTIEAADAKTHSHAGHAH
ncbi:copper chaperone PCu(A)C [uncultured Roseibium sp.]|uniref:copper chaperone PCu(A)C n=1 Tax=uncultured Roseibium sp. TaxID=1936171 RepID=UPI003217F8F0